MSLSESNNKEPSKLNKLLNDKAEQPSIQSRLPRAAGAPPPSQTPVLASSPRASSPVKSQPKQSYSRFGPIFWTVASVISLLVNIGTVIALVVVMQILGGPKATLSFAQSQANGLLAGYITTSSKWTRRASKPPSTWKKKSRFNLV